MKRNWKQRLRYAAVFLCPECGTEWVLRRLPPWISAHRRCPRCGDVNLERLPSRDRIDPLYKSPISLIQALMGARLWWCALCRIQFYDLRPAVPDRSGPLEAESGGDPGIEAVGTSIPGRKQPRRKAGAQTAEG